MTKEGTIRYVFLVALAFGLPLATAQAVAPPASAPARAERGAAAGVNTQTAELYELQAAFHRYATVRDAFNGDSPAVIDQRIHAMLSLWTEDAVLVLHVGNASDGTYAGRGDLQSNCQAPSANPGTRGTLCTFFKYVAGSFKPANRFVSLAPSYKTHFDIHGNTSSVYFECHYFNVAPDPTGKPLWTAASHITFQGRSRKEEGRWLFSYADAPTAEVPAP